MNTASKPLLFEKVPLPVPILLELFLPLLDEQKALEIELVHKNENEGLVLVFVANLPRTVTNKQVICTTSAIYIIGKESGKVYYQLQKE